MDTFALTLPLAIAAAAPPLIWLFRRSPNLREAVSFTAAALSPWALTIRVSISSVAPPLKAWPL